MGEVGPALADAAPVLAPRAIPGRSIFELIGRWVQRGYIDSIAEAIR